MNKHYKLTDKQIVEVIQFLNSSFLWWDDSEVAGKTFEQVVDLYKPYIGNAPFEFNGFPIVNPLYTEDMKSLYYEGRRGLQKDEKYFITYKKICDYFGEDNINKYFGEYLKHIGEPVEEEKDDIVESFPRNPKPSELRDIIYQDMTEDEKFQHIWNEKLDNIKRYCAYNDYLIHYPFTAEKRRYCNKYYPELEKFLDSLSEEEREKLLDRFFKEVWPEGSPCFTADFFKAEKGINDPDSKNTLYDIIGWKESDEVVATYNIIKETIDFWKSLIDEKDTIIESTLNEQLPVLELRRIVNDNSLTDDEKSIKLFGLPFKDVLKYNAYNFFVKALSSGDSTIKRLATEYIDKAFLEFKEFISKLSDNEISDLNNNFHSTVKNHYPGFAYDIFDSYCGDGTNRSIKEAFQRCIAYLDAANYISDSINYWRDKVKSPDTFIEAYVKTTEKPIYKSNDLSVYRFTNETLPALDWDEGFLKSDLGYLLVSENDIPDDDFVSERDNQYLINLDTLDLDTNDEDVISLDNLKYYIENTLKDNGAWKVIDKVLKDTSLFDLNELDESGKIVKRFSWDEFRSAFKASGRNHIDSLGGETIMDVLSDGFNPEYYFEDVDVPYLVDCISDENWNRIEKELKVTKEQVMEDAPQAFYTALRNAYERCMFNAEYSALLSDITEGIKECFPKELLPCFDLTSDEMFATFNKEQLEKLFDYYYDLKEHDYYINDIYGNCTLKNMISDIIEMKLYVRERSSYLDFNSDEFNDCLEIAIDEL